MSKFTTPHDYKSQLNLYDTQSAIARIKQIFQKNFSEDMNLQRISAPLFVTEESGLNDNLNGTERPVDFDIPAFSCRAQIVHSLAKWKRLALHKYGFSEGQGIYTDMNAIRRDEDPDNIHSVYVDQWDWEKIIKREDRNLEFLKKTVTCIVKAICDTQAEIMNIYPQLRYKLSEDVAFITSQELEDMYPEYTPKEREAEILKKHPTVFVMQIGKKLKSGKIHDGRAPDYDDWELNGDLLFWNNILQEPIEISSMGIRVDEESLMRQLIERGHAEWSRLPFHKMLLNNELPLTIGGGIGQSRLCMLLLNKAHIGEVQVSVWDDATASVCQRASIEFL